MEHSIGVGLIIGGVTASSIYVYQSNKFSKYQKAFLLICVIFPPLQWISILIILGINNYGKQKSPEVLRDKQAIKEVNSFDYQIQSLKELKDKEILTEQEYSEKVKNLEDSKKEYQIKISEDYKKLKSLYEDGILTKEEFESKVEIVRSKSEKTNEKVLEPKKPEETQNLFKQEQSETQNPILNIDNQLVKLKNLRTKGVLTQKEYKDKFDQLNNLKIELSFKNSKDYMDMVMLHKQGILTDDDFISKTELLMKNYKEKVNSKINYWNRSTIIFKIAIFIFIVIYPFIVQLIYQEYLPHKHFNPEWSSVYWGVSMAIFIILMKQKFLIYTIAILSIIYPFLVNSTIAI